MKKKLFQKKHFKMNFIVEKPRIINKFESIEREKKLVKKKIRKLILFYLLKILLILFAF